MQERKAWRMTDSTFGQDSGEQRVVAYAAFDAAGGDAARRLSEDFAQALAAYEELSRRQLPIRLRGSPPSGSSARRRPGRRRARGLRRRGPWSASS